MALPFDYILLILFAEHSYMVCVTTFICPEDATAETNGRLENKKDFVL